MVSNTQTAPVSMKAVWAGRVISALPVLMLLMGASMKLSQNKTAMEGFVKFGFPEGLAVKLGILELLCTIVYIIPQTSVLGAILMTGYLGGAVVTHVRVGDPIANILTPVLLGVMVWGGLFLRDKRLRELIPFKN